MGYGALPHVYPRLLTFAILLPIAGYGALPHDYEKPLPFALELALVALRLLPSLLFFALQQTGLAQEVAHFLCDGGKLGRGDRRPGDKDNLSAFGNLGQIQPQALFQTAPGLVAHDRVAYLFADREAGLQAAVFAKNAEQNHVVPAAGFAPAVDKAVFSIFFQGNEQAARLFCLHKPASLPAPPGKPKILTETRPEGSLQARVGRQTAWAAARFRSFIHEKKGCNKALQPGLKLSSQFFSPLGAAAF